MILLYQLMILDLQWKIVLILIKRWSYMFWYYITSRMLNKILRHVNILYSTAMKWILRSFTTVFDAFLHLPDLNVRPTQIYNICLKIKKKEKYVCNEIRFPLHLWTREREWIRVYCRIFVCFQGCNIEKTTTKIPIV